MLKIKRFTVVSVLLMLFVSTSLFAASVDTYGDYTIPYVMPDDIAMCGVYEESQATIQPVKSGLWTDNSVWPNNTKPTSGDVVVVPSGRTLTMVGTCRALQIRVSGTLNAVNTQPGGAWINLETGGIIVENGGLLEIGTEAQPYHATERCVITLTGNSSESDNQNRKAIMVMLGGQLELHGKPRKSWTNLAVTSNAGSNQITLKEAVDWEVGDVIALTSTALASKSGNTWENVDQVEIQSISSDKKTLTLTTNLQYKHIGGSKTYTRSTDGKKWTVNIQGEVGLLSHYIKIQGKMDSSNETDGFGGHIMIMGDAYAENIELYKMGQKGELGRYPWHWHLCEDKSQGNYLRNSSIHRSFNRAVTIHGTDFVTVDGVFAYDHIGHGIFLEDGGERDNIIKNNVVFVTRRPKQGEQLTPSDNFSDDPILGDTPQNRTPASYWITNPNNIFENNVAAGTEGTGFWFAFPEAVMQLSANLDYFDGINPSTEPLGEFNGFVVHTCMNGWDVFDRLNPDHSIKRNLGWNISTRQLIKNGLFYGNNQAIYSGLGVGGINKNTVFYDCAFSDNLITTMLAGDMTIENSLFNADSDLGVFNGTRSFFRFYDGPGRHIDCHFETWNRSNADMILRIEGGGATENFNPTFSGTTKGFSEPFRFHFEPLVNEDNAAGRKAGQFFKDTDGSMLGSPGTLIRDFAFLRDGNEVRDPSWSGAAKVDYFFAGLWLNRVNGTGANISVVRTKPGTPDACLYNSATSTTYKFPMIVNEGFTYNYYFDRAPSSKTINAIWYRGTNGDLGLACFKGFAKLGGISVSGNRVNTKAQIESATQTSYFIDGNDVYVMFRGKEGDERIAVNINWNNDGSFQPVSLPCTTNDFTPLVVNPNYNDADGDGYTDAQEQEDCRLTMDASDLSFDFTGVDEGFTLNKLTSGTLSESGEWQLVANNSNDPFIVRSSLSFSGNDVPSITIRMKAEKAGPVQLFWGNEDSGFSGDKSIPSSYTTANEWQEIAFNLSGNTQWSGKTITQLRFDFVADANNTVNHWIDWMRGPNGSDPCVPVPAEIRFVSPTGTEFTEGDDLGVEIVVDEGQVENIRLYINDVLVRQEGLAPYEWGTANVGIADPLLLDLASGDYILKAVATDDKGEVVLETMEITVGTVTSVSGLIENNISVYPNPSEDGLFKLSELVDFEVNDIQGHLITKGNGESIDLSVQPKGVYILHVGSKQLKLIR